MVAKALLCAYWFLQQQLRYHNDLGILPLELEPKALQQLWRKTLCLLCSEVFWRCNQESLSMREKKVAPELITAMGPLTAMISTFNLFPDVRPCWILL